MNCFSLLVSIKEATLYHKDATITVKTHSRNCKHNCEDNVQLFNFLYTTNCRLGEGAIKDIHVGKASERQKQKERVRERERERERERCGSHTTVAPYYNYLVQ